MGSVVRDRRRTSGLVSAQGDHLGTKPSIRRGNSLEIRDSGCRFPGCSMRFTDAHHIVHWADGGETALSNLILLRGHQHRALHEEGFRVRVREGGIFQFFDRTGWPLPNHAPLVSGASPPPGGGSAVGGVFEREMVDRLIDENRRLGVDPGAFTPSATWKSEADIPWERQARAWEALDRS